MPLKDLFTSKANKLRPDPRIRWFGKLPTYPDYYSSGTDEAWTVEFSEWVLKGFELYHSRIAGSGKPRERLPVAACALRLPRSRMTVFASVLDYGGDLRGRPFPMCFYAGVPSASWPGPTSDRVVPAARVIRDLIALRREVPRFLNSPGRFEATFGAREVDLAGVCGGSSDESWLSAGKEMPFGEWFGKTRGGLSAGDWEAWERAVACWGENLAKHTGSRFEATVILPLVMGSFLDAQIAGWIHWLERRFDLRRKFLSLVVVGDPDGGSGILGVIARELVADDFLLVTTLGRTLPYVEDLTGVKVDSTPGEAAEKVGGVPVGTCLPATWTDFVSRLATLT